MICVDQLIVNLLFLPRCGDILLFCIGLNIYIYILGREEKKRILDGFGLWWKRAPFGFMFIVMC